MLTPRKPVLVAAGNMPNKTIEEEKAFSSLFMRVCLEL
jgi:hypothetical protein